jgi:hypothetical protein
MRSLAAAAAAAALVVAPLGAGAARSRVVGDRCGTSCYAAYAAIARALPGDRSNVLARAVLGTRGFDYAQLARALQVPSPAEIRRRWRRSCEARFSDRAEVARCDALIRGPVWARPEPSTSPAA